MLPALLTLLLSLSLAPQAQDAKLNRIKELSRERGWSFLCYDRPLNYVLYVDRGRVHQIFPPGSELFRTGHHARPSLSPDGGRIVFVRPVSKTEADEMIMVHDLASSQTTELLTWPSRLWGLAWSPDGAEIAFVADQGSKTGLFTVRVVDRSVTQWRSDREVSTDAAPSWSPGGNAIAVQRDVGLGAEIVIIERALTARVGWPQAASRPGRQRAIESRSWTSRASVASRSSRWDGGSRHLFPHPIHAAADLWNRVVPRIRSPDLSPDARHERGFPGDLSL